MTNQTAPYTTFALACRDVVAALGIDAGCHSMFCTRDEAESVANGITAALGTLPVWWEQPTCRGWRWCWRDGSTILTLHVIEPVTMADLVGGVS